MRFFIISFIVSLSSLVTSGRSYYFRHYGNDRRLSDNTVMASLLSKRGFTRFGTKKVYFTSLSQGEYRFGVISSSAWLIPAISSGFINESQIRSCL